MSQHIVNAIPCSLLSISTAVVQNEIQLLLTLRLNEQEKYDTITVSVPATQSLRLSEDLNRLMETSSLKSVLTPKLLEESDLMVDSFIKIGSS